MRLLRYSQNCRIPAFIFVRKKEHLNKIMALIVVCKLSVHLCVNYAIMETSVKNTARFDARISREQKSELERAARLGGYRSLSEFIIASAQEKARKIINEQETIVASQRDAEVFFDALVNVVTPNEALLKATEKYKQNSAK